MAGIQIFVCFLLLMLDTSMSFEFPKSSVYTDGLHKIKSDKERYIELQQKQDAMGSHLANVNATVLGMTEKVEALVKQKESESKTLREIKEQVVSLVSEQTRVTTQLDVLSKGVRKVEENRKDVKRLTTDITYMKEVEMKTDRRVTSVNTTLNHVQRSLSRIRLGATTCAEVKQCSADATDGEFWLYPSLLDEKRVKIYCSEMNTSEPKEFVSLSKPNEGEYPDVTNPSCRRETKQNHPKKKLIGHTSFNKIQVNITTMEIIRNGWKYAESKGRPRSYGSAGDCYAPISSTSKCGPKGFFNIDTRETGLRVKTDLVWSKLGNMAAAICKRGAEGQTINITCGGYCGDCVPKGGHIILEPSPNEDLKESEATYVKCPLYQP